MTWRVVQETEAFTATMAVVDSENAARKICDMPLLTDGWTAWPDRRVSGPAGALNPANREDRPVGVPGAAHGVHVGDAALSSARIDFVDLESRILAHAATSPDRSTRAKVCSFGAMYGRSNPDHWPFDWLMGTAEPRRPRPIRDVCRTIAAELTELAGNPAVSLKTGQHLDSLARSLRKAINEAPND